jgi:uncharacterized FlaG/YvyC family protein
MSEQALKSIASGTGTFEVPKDLVKNSLPAQRGNTGRQSGNPLPEPKMDSRPDFERLARQLKMASQSIGRDLRFLVDMEGGRSVIQVLDRETGEIVRQIPREEAAAMLRNGVVSGIRLFDALV